MSWFIVLRIVLLVAVVAALSEVLRWMVIETMDWVDEVDHAFKNVQKPKPAIPPTMNPSHPFDREFS